MAEQRPEFLGDVRRVGRHQDTKRLQDGTLAALGVREFVGADHERADRRIEGEALVVLLDFLDGLVQGFPFGLCRFFSGNREVALSIKIEFPELADEAGHALDAVSIPRFGHLHRTKEHLVHAQGVSAVFLHQVIGVLHIVFRLRHLLDLPATDVLSVFEDELGVLEVGHPVFEGLDVEDVVVHNIDVHVDRRGFVFLAEVERHELVGADDTIDEIGPSLYHALVDEFPEGFVLAADADIEEELVPEAGIDKVAGSVFRPADVEIDVLPIFVGLFGDEGFVVLRVHVAQIVGTGACKAGHGAVLALTAVVRPVLGACQWGLTRFGGQKLVDFGEQHREFVFRDGIRHPILIIYGKRFAPVALAAEDGVAQAEIDRAVADTHLLNPFNHCFAGILDRHPVNESGIDAHTRLAVEALLPGVRVADFVDRRCDHLPDGQVEMAGEGKVAAVVGGHGHDGAGAVVAQHIVADPDGDAFLGDGVDGERAREDAAHLLDLRLPFTFGAVLGPGDIGLHGLLLLRSGNRGNHLVFRTEHHERDAENGVGASGENLEGALTLDPFDMASHVDFLPIELSFLGQREPDCGTFAAPDPVALDFLKGVGPIDGVEAIEQTFGVSGDAQDPLPHQLAFHRKAAANGETVHHFIVGEHRAEFRAPVHPCVGEVGQTVVHQDLLTLFLGSIVPFLRRELHRLGLCHIQAFRAAGGKSLHQLGNRAGLFRLVAVIAVEELDKRPLRPLVVVRVAGLERTVPVEREPDFVELFAIAVHIFLSSDGGVLPCLDGILLRRQPESVISHRVQHVEAFLPLIAGIDVGGDIA